jgi:uncharacterized integral membrane protein
VSKVFSADPPLSNLVIICKVFIFYNVSPCHVVVFAGFIELPLYLYHF